MAKAKKIKIKFLVDFTNDFDLSQSPVKKDEVVEMDEHSAASFLKSNMAEIVKRGKK